MHRFTRLFLQVAVSMFASLSVVGAAENPFANESPDPFSIVPESLIQSPAFGDHKNELRQVDFTGCEISVLSASDSVLPNAFGDAVAISGNVIVMGAPRESHAGTASGAVYVYERTGASWTTESKLLAADTVGGDQFGFSVAVSGDWIAVGAPFDDDLGSLSGAVYLFYREISGWSQVDKLLPADGMTQDRFGYSLALENNRLVVGAIGKPGGSFAGAAYIFDYVGGAWVQQTQFTGTGVGGNDYFGDSLAIEGDLIAVGASEDNGLYQYDPPGKCYLFRRNGSAWIQEASLSPNGGGLNDRFGASVTINGGMVVVGSPYDDGAALNTGSAYVFRRLGSTWVQEARLEVTDELFFAQLGQSVAAYGNLILLGAGGHDLLGNGAGAAFLFRWTNGHWFEELSFFHPTNIEYPQFGNAISLDAGIAVIGAPSLAAGGLGPGFAVVYDLLPGTDCDQDGVNDACEPDCNLNDVGDECDIAAGTSVNCNNNRVPDECEPDCNANQQTDECDVVAGTSGDCNFNLVPDECELDCNANAVPDSCDIDLFGAADCNSNRIPDECENDCNFNSVPDECDLDNAFSTDCNGNGVPDECDARSTSVDCNLNMVPDECEVDCNQNEIPDECDISAGTSGDCTGNGVPDDCEPDCNQNSEGDSCDIFSGHSQDLDANGYPDECQQTRRVPSQYPTIQAAVDASQNGDTVLIANGTYSGYGNYNISVWGKEIIIRSENGPANCVLDVQDAGRGVSYFYGYRPYKARLEGLTIRHGRAAIGGAVFCDRLTQIQIRHCVFRANDATNYDHSGGRYLQILWIGLGQAATFLAPSVN